MQKYDTDLQTLWTAAGLDNEPTLVKSAELVDGLWSMSTNLKPIPEAVDAVKSRLFEFKAEYEERLWENKDTYSLMTDGILKEIVKDFDYVIEQDGDASLTDYDKRKLNVYASTRDLIHAMLNTFDRDHSINPVDFASTFHLILWKTEAGGYEVEITYNKDQLILPEPCEADGVNCPYDSFKNIMEDLQFKGDLEKDPRDDDGRGQQLVGRLLPDLPAEALRLQPVRGLLPLRGQPLVVVFLSGEVARPLDGPVAPQAELVFLLLGVQVGVLPQLRARWS